MTDPIKTTEKKFRLKGTLMEMTLTQLKKMESFGYAKRMNEDDDNPYFLITAKGQNLIGNMANACNN